MEKNSSFKVALVINGDTIKVSPNWVWGNSTGNVVRVIGYSISTDVEAEWGKGKLEKLLSGESVELKNPAMRNMELCCEVYLNDVNIARYFPELQRKNKKNA